MQPAEATTPTDASWWSCCSKPVRKEGTWKDHTNVAQATVKRTPPNPKDQRVATRSRRLKIDDYDYCTAAYSTLACRNSGTSGSACFQSARKS